MEQTIKERARECAEKVTDRLIYHKGLKSQYGHILDALNKQDRIARKEEREKAREAFCLATCKGNLHRSTCTSLGTCNEYDEFCKIIRKAMK